jgi:DMSO/TMAO reductase YedYZ molybdopterin-dependent catalytic subunit
VTKWSKFDTVWTGVSVDYLLQGVDTGDLRFVTASCDGGYTTNLPLEDVMGGKAWVAYKFDNEPLDPQHGGPARLLVPHLYFWKSAKWVRGIELQAEDRAGFWETYGYHNHGDPWQEQRYSGD